ncbi:coenzyme PQQ precursor peptide PqqA [Actinocorallia herbida]|uniref:Coenzyme PQQ synthesis protein A n=1 Tax=Actinocorallia herbida TaxID=58109 RepID=A0A3N1D0W4_9ACTN|nr:pyrroloquinoline quinone precursor peptide PqqA [Actinocorallia herbida]ROO87173.1 coenzyme PQQ precursor peptide PqqA [Actinocorallia herbida]
MESTHGHSSRDRERGQKSVCWRSPGYEVIETSMEVTMYFGGKL